MLRAQWPQAAARRVAPEGSIALGSATASSAQEAGPVEGAGGRFALIADARLDDRAGLIRQLGLSAGEGAEASDARLMMRAFERWGPEAVEGFVGEFALALWDRASETLLLARDVSGQRPLHFHAHTGGVAAASMGKGLHALDFVPRGVDEGRMMETLAGIPHEGRHTFLRGIERVEPGEALAFGHCGYSARRLWSPPEAPLRFASHEECAEALRERIDVAVGACLRDAGPVVGSQLSAGLDSSAVTTSAALQFRGPVLAYTAVPSGAVPSLPGGRFGDEGALAAQTAALYPNIEHRLIGMGERLPLENLAWQLPLFERPDINLPNIAWNDRINDDAAGRGVRVMLIGTAGNGTISYGGTEALGAILADGGIAGCVRLWVEAQRAGVPLRTLAGQTARRLLPAGAVGLVERVKRRPSDPRLGMLNVQAPGARAIVARYDHIARRAEGSVAERVRMMGRVDPGTYTKGVFLRWGIELRDPTLDRRILDFCLRLPANSYFHGGAGRAPIRTALRGRVPDAVRCETQRGLQAPAWFAMLSAARGEAEDIFARIAGDPVAQRLIDLPRMRALINEWPAPRGDFGPLAYRYGLLRGLVAGEFIRRHPAGGDPGAIDAARLPQ